MMKPALFLDRDGVINVDYGYVHSRERFHFTDGIFELARTASARGYLIVVVTNQAGIGRGLYGEAEFYSLTDWMCSHFLKQNVKIDRVYFSPYHPTAGIGRYQQDHVSRKPRPGMLIQAQRELKIDMTASILIGDKCSDIEAGSAAGVGTNLLLQADFAPDLPCVGCTRIATLREALPFFADFGVWDS